MNGTALVLVTLLIAVLIAVGLGSTQMQANLENQVAQMTSQRDTTLQVALEAKGQRDNAIQDREAANAARDAAVTALNQANERIAALEAEQKKIAQDLSNAQGAVSEQSRIIESLRNEKVALQAQLEQALAAGPVLVPATGEQVAPPQAAESSENTICLPVRADTLPNQLGIGLAVLAGMMALGSGGYIVYRHDPNRKYTITMSKDQLREYARYQRERGNRIG
ncbi:MAG: hypothetical protein EHM21_10935 [Chloroflexi bacterium]|nr:MAG: hypothetical protein EHM21_10935 [Chloroflexota bacterium]